MNGPSDEFRAEVYTQLVGLPNIEDNVRLVNQEVEDRLDQILNGILREAENDIGASETLRLVEDGLEGGRIEDDEIERQHELESEQLLASVDQWISVASYASAWVYAPQSPSPGKLAGWAKKIAETLRKLAHLLLTPLQVAARALGAVQWSVGAAFPWGVTVSLTWQ